MSIVFMVKDFYIWTSSFTYSFFVSTFTELFYWNKILYFSMTSPSFIEELITCKNYYVQKYLLKVTCFEVQRLFIYFTFSLSSIFLCW